MLLGVVLLLSGQTLAGSVEVVIRDAVGGDRLTNVTVLPKPSAPEGGRAALTPAQVTALAEAVQADALDQLVLVSVIAVGVMAVFASVVGWWVAGRVLRPLHTITTQARTMSASNIHERIALGGPPDELRDLADTFDRMLDRLDRAFTARHRFVANASHELRTPLAVERAIIQVRLANATTAEEIATARDELLAANRRLDQLLEGLLLLARSEDGLPGREPVDLAAVAEEVVREALAVPPAHAPRGVRGQVVPVGLVVPGDQVLLARLLDNLVRNAMLYNEPGGWFRVVLDPRGAVTVSNSGPRVPEPERLFEPFRRGADRMASPAGAGLGLAIVRSIAEAHDGSATATARPGGGLDVTVTLPVHGRG